MSTRPGNPPPMREPLDIAPAPSHKANMSSPAPLAPAPLAPERAKQLAAEFGLKPDEFERVLAILGRQPSMTELGIFSVMWSEHCSYKSRDRKSVV